MIYSNQHENIYRLQIYRTGQNKTERKVNTDFFCNRRRRTPNIYLFKRHSGMGLEIGYAKALGIPVIIATPRDEDCDYLTGLYDKLVTFDTSENLIGKLKKGDVFTEFEK